VLPQLQQILEREGDLPSWDARRAFWRIGARRATPPSRYSEMALLERELRAARGSIESLWPATFETPLQATVSLIDDAEWHVEPGVARVRAKIAAGPAQFPAPFAGSVNSTYPCCSTTTAAPATTPR